MTSDGETVQPQALRALAEQLESQVHPLLERAVNSFKAAEIEGEKFSTAGIAMQIVYPGTKEFAETDAELVVVSAWAGRRCWRRCARPSTRRSTPWTS